MDLMLLFISPFQFEKKYPKRTFFTVATRTHTPMINFMELNLKQ